MKIQYISDHSVLEYDEVQLLLDLGHEVFSNGAYLDPAGHITLPRPGLRGAKTYPQFMELARTTARTDMPKELIDPFDVIIVMHSPNVIIQNWDKLREKVVIWRSIGQSVPRIEKALERCRLEGLKIIRYSPKEENIPGYIGADAIIRFYKDEDQYKDWTGEDHNIISFAQSLKGRRDFCHYDEVMGVIETFDGTVYGPGNEDLGKYNGGQIPYEMQIQKMQRATAMPYGGTWPAAYTLSFIEALMTGLPVIAISKALAHYPQYEALDFYEVDEILAQIGGIVCDTKEAMIFQAQKLLSLPEHAANISYKQRELAVAMFGKKVISEQWREFLDGLKR